MRVNIGLNTLELARGDITREDTEAIANAANSALAGGGGSASPTGLAGETSPLRGGVDGAIHRAAGPSLMKELREKYPDGCPTGSAVITTGGTLGAKWVLHAVGPRYHGMPEDAELLASAYRSCLALCGERGIRSIAFPSISTGIYGYPLNEAAPIALRTVAGFLKEHENPALVRFVLFDEGTFAAYSAAMRDCGLLA